MLDIRSGQIARDTWARPAFQMPRGQPDCVYVIFQPARKL